MDIDQKVRELGELLAGTSEVKRFQQAQGNFNADTEAQSILNEFQQTQQAIRAGRMRDASLDQVQVERLKEVQNAFQQNEVIRELRESQQMLESLLQRVNRNISETSGIDLGAFDGGGCCG